MLDRLDVEALVASAADGDETAWSALVDAYSGLVWAVARGVGLGRADAADVSQTTWLRLAEHVRSIREPASVGAWLATTARREALRTAQAAGRSVLRDPLDPSGGVADADAPTVDAGLLAEERQAALWRALRRLPMPCRSLLRLLLADPAPSYAEVSAALNMPIGSIGPTRARCLDRLRVAPELIQIASQN